MGISQISHMDVVANACSVVGGIVGAVDQNIFPLPKRDLQDQGDQMRLRMMRLPQLSQSARGIEVSQASVAKTVRAMKPGQHSLDQQLRLTVRVGRLEVVRLFDRNSFRLAIKCRS